MPFRSTGTLSLRVPPFPSDPATENCNLDFKL